MKKKVQSEQEIQRDIVKYLEKGGHYVIKVEKASKSGTPDLVVCTMDSGKFYAIEVKRVGKRKNTTPLQKLHLELINKTGGKAFVADSVWDVMEENL